MNLYHLLVHLYTTSTSETLRMKPEWSTKTWNSCATTGEHPWMVNGKNGELNWVDLEIPSIWRCKRKYWIRILHMQVKSHGNQKEVLVMSHFMDSNESSLIPQSMSPFWHESSTFHRCIHVVFLFSKFMRRFRCQSGSELAPWRWTAWLCNSRCNMKGLKQKEAQDVDIFDNDSKLWFKSSSLLKYVEGFDGFMLTKNINSGLFDIDTGDWVHLDVTWYAEYPEWSDCSLNYPNWCTFMWMNRINAGGLLIEGRKSNKVWST